MLAQSARLGKRASARLPALARQFQGSGEMSQQPVELSKLKDSFIEGSSANYLEELEERYRSNPKSVDKSWASFFHSMGARGARVCPGGLAAAAAGSVAAAPAQLRVIGRLCAGYQPAGTAGVGFGPFVGGQHGCPAPQASQARPAGHAGGVARRFSTWRQTLEAHVQCRAAAWQNAQTAAVHTLGESAGQLAPGKPAQSGARGG